MPNDFTIDINLQNNAKSSAQDLNSVVSAIDRVTEAENKHNATATKNARTQIKVNRELLKTLKAIKHIQVNMVKEQFRYNREQEKQDKSELSREKQKLEARKRLLSMGMKLAAAYAFSRLPAAIMNANERYAQLNTSAIASGATPEQVQTLQAATRGFGGNDKTAAAFYRNMNRLGKQFYIDRNLPIHEALQRITGLQDILFKGGKLQTDNDKILDELNLLFQKSNQYKRMAIQEALGFDDSIFQLLSLRRDEFLKTITSAKSEKKADVSKANRFQRKRKTWQDKIQILINKYTPDPVKDAAAAIFGATDAIPGSTTILTAAGTVGALKGGKWLLPKAWQGIKAGGKYTWEGVKAGGKYTWEGVKAGGRHAIKAGGRLSPWGTIALTTLTPLDAGNGEDELLFKYRPSEEQRIKKIYYERSKDDIRKKYPQLVDFLKLMDDLFSGSHFTTSPPFIIPKSPNDSSNNVSINGDIIVNVSGASAASPEAIGSAVADSVAEKVIAVWQGIDHGQAMVYNA